MARFYADIKGAKGGVSRLGNSISGIQCHIRGWDVGVFIRICADGDKDIVHVYRTGGSNGGSPRKLLAQFDQFSVEESKAVTKQGELKL